MLVMRSAVSLIAIAIFAVGFVWQYGGWLLEWIGRFIGTRGLSSSYDAFANSFVAPLLAEGSIVRRIDTSLQRFVNSKDILMACGEPHQTQSACLFTSNR